MLCTSVSISCSTVLEVDALKDVYSSGGGVNGLYGLAVVIPHLLLTFDDWEKIIKTKCFSYATFSYRRNLRLEDFKTCILGNKFEGNVSNFGKKMES